MDDFDLHRQLVFRSEVIAAGGTDAELRRAVGTGVQERVWRGSYLPAAATTLTFTEKLERYRATVIAAAQTSGPGRTVSHQSAAALHRIPMLTPDFATVHFTSATTGKTIVRGVIHQAKLADSAVVGMNDVALTSRARSMCDVARNGTLQQGVCVLDSGLQLGVTLDEIEEEVKRLSRHHGAARLRHAVSLADGLSESIGESLSRLVLADCPSIPPPELQVEIEVEIDGRRKTVRSDYGWRDRRGVLRVVGEFDGKLKYHRSSPWGDRLPEEVLFAEKVREDAIRATGPRMVRWIWRDAKRPKILHAKVIAALRAGGIID